ncbi:MULTISPECIES: pectinesterase family protein [unclassified Bradyrhizobium]|uniref:pectinesterase family protein n=1 Tax=unclassified Bradyrhizobium TaxID=2631580 RepID=UPI0020B2CDE9|nr:MULTISPECIES: pectinesterase family protein [unclassified Bradyrhizobium]MCP3396997.1 pectinesterase family protein [Bradyrhizobium sp. CCGB20]MCP3405510.1 pectinesterase family protein [Bradyrhizobium sp. CCGB01]
MRDFLISVAILTGCFQLSEANAERLLVSKSDGLTYRSIQEAVDALPARGGDILIAPGIYREKIRIGKPAVHIKGTGKKPEDTVVVYGDGAIKAGGTIHSATMDASGDDFRLDNLTIQNDYSLNPSNPPSQAVALSLTGDKDVITRVRLLGAQDTLFANMGPNGRTARQYFSDCYIEGHVDYIFGNAKAYFQHCELHGIASQAVVYTAQSRTSPDEDSAYVFDRCTLTADSAARAITLGRPWRSYATVIFLSTKMNAPVMADGWSEWKLGKTNRLKTAYYAEYESTGIGANLRGREPYSHQLNDSEAKQWSLKAFFADDTNWLPSSSSK